MSTIDISSSDIETKCVNTIRTLAMDAVQKANSGHSGTAMALAPLAHVLYTRILRHDPSNPDWYNRDRFVLSAGHASMLLYSTLHLTGYDVSLDDIKEFRQWGSKTPGHPEVHHTQGVEVTTGPLGQGFAHAVGMAMAEEYLRATLSEDVIDHNIYVLCSDGDLMEGISYEAASLAGHNKLSKLIAIYDDNKITIDGSTDLTFSEDVASRFRSQGWNVIEAGEISEDLDELENVLNQAKAQSTAPTIIILRSHIGYPSPQFTDTSAAHGALTNADDLTATKAAMDMPADAFEISSDVRDFYTSVKDRFASESSQWTKDHAGSDTIASVLNGTNSNVAALAQGALADYFADEAGNISAPEAGDSIATRVSCSTILSTFANSFSSVLGGSADLTGNTGTKLSAGNIFHPTQRDGRQIHFGIREHAMAAAANGMALSYNLRPFVGTFFVFADYMRPSIRLAAITGAPVLFVFSHDSIGVGEDGPTHQPIEQLASLRAMPGLNVVRPADGFETAAAIEDHYAQGNGPTALILTRQNVPTLSASADGARQGITTGAYEINDEPNPDVVLVGTGSEVHLCADASDELKKAGINARVVSMPNMTRFLQSEDRTLLPSGVPVVSIEAASTFGWSAISDVAVGIDRFGASAPASDVFTHLGITTSAVVDAAKKIVSQ
jgi:transketolase